jgi:hypothetical protein
MELRGFVALLFLCGCTPAESPGRPAAQEGDRCAIGADTLATCAPMLTCKIQPHASVPLGPHGPETASGEGGSCGGVAGFHCAEGLDCKMSDEQSRAADGMGSCATVSKCVR